jgi:hypothetical protein
MISSLTTFLQNRKGKLVTYLNNNIDEMALEKQHQFYGAIGELDRILNTLHSHRDKEVNGEVNPDEIFLFRPIHDNGIVRRVTSFLKDIF